MSTDAVAIIGFVVLFVLMLLRVPVGMAMGLVGVTGFGYIVGGGPTLKMIGQTSMRTVTDYTFGVIPMFLLMGAFVTRLRHEPRAVSGRQYLARAPARRARLCNHPVLRRLRGDLGLVGRHGRDVLDGRLSGNAPLQLSAIVRLRRDRGRRLTRRDAAAVDRAWRFTASSPSRISASCSLPGILPGLLAISMYITTIVIIGWLRPGFLPSGPRATWKQRFEAMREVWAPLLLFVFVIGGLYGGLFTPTEAGGMGAGGAFLIGVLRGRLSRKDIRASLLQATRTAAAVFTVLIGALLFGYFLTVTQTPQKVTMFLTGLGLGRYGVLALIMLMYLLLGCLMDALAMVILTVPIMFPVILSLGFDPIWFGVIIVMTVELGLIHPPVGMIVFVIKSVVHDVNFLTIFKGVLPFIITDLIRLTILIAFPIIALYLPSQM